MRHPPILKSLLAIMPLLLMGCATSQTVHWQDDGPVAAAQVALLGAQHKAKITDLNGAHFWGRDVSIAEDAVRWTRTRDGEPQVLPLAEVAKIEFVTGRHVGKGAWIGALSGGAGLALLVGIDCIRETRGNLCDEFGTADTLLGVGYFGAMSGAVLGVLIGAFSADKVIFVPQN